LIQVFVETLDRCFENVCELDLVFHMDKVCSIRGLDQRACVSTDSSGMGFCVCSSWLLRYQVHGIIDEIVQAGMVLETSIADILKALEAQNKFERETRLVKKTILQDPNAKPTN
jgi:hypothetical protein